MCFGPTEKKNLLITKRKTYKKSLNFFWLIMKIYRKIIDEKSTQFIFQL